MRGTALPDWQPTRRRGFATVMVALRTLAQLLVDQIEYWGRLSFLKAGLFYADRIATVSPTYAREIRSKAFGCGLEGLLEARADRLSGILNGIDTRVWDPGTDVALRRNYGADSLDDKAGNRIALQAEMGLAADEDVAGRVFVGELSLDGTLTAVELVALYLNFDTNSANLQASSA